jgi:hypothetical protein
MARRLHKGVALTIYRLVMRTVIASALLVTLVRESTLLSSEPVALLMWGGGLLLLSVALRPGFARRLSVPNPLGQRKPLSSAPPSLTQPAQS